jgi:hypothetical protein
MQSETSFFENKLNNISYSSNSEYRNILRNIFLMNPLPPENADSLDEETLDEILFDDTNIIKMFDNIYDKTIHNPLFSELYELAAACFLSTDKKLGVTVLFAYDYLFFYYPLLFEFFEKEENLNKNNKNYIELKKRLLRR